MTTRRSLRRSGVLISTLLLAGLLTAVPRGADAAPASAPPSSLTPTARAAGTGGKVTVRNGCLTSVPEPSSTTPVKICWTSFRPAGASRRHPVPMIMHSHGWGGSRTTQAAGFKRFLRRGYGVISFDQRGFGASGGQAHVENPAYEGFDVRRLVDLVSQLRWVQQDGPGDPRLGAIGGSYGGGYQFLGAFEELRRHGTPVFDALAPEITWNDLNDTLTPEGVVRTAWAAALSAAALPSNALPTKIYLALTEGAVTGEVPDGTAGQENLPAFFRRNGPKYHVEHHRRLDIPVLFGQGLTDSLFPLEQGLTNWRTAITDRARRKSIFVGYNGGHVLPSVFPRGVSVTSDPCSRRLAGRDFQQLSLRFFDEQLRGRDTGLRGYGRIHLATPASRCTTIASPRANRTRRIGTVASTTAAGAPIPYEVADGPISIAGTPYLTGTVTALGLKNRAFYGLAIGSNPANAQLVQDNVLPVNEPRPVRGVKRRVALPSVAVDVPKGQHLYLVASPISDTFVGMGSRTPGLVTIDNTIVHLPVVRR